MKPTPTLFLIFFFLLFGSGVWAQTPITLAPDEFFIQNYETVSLSNDLVNVPISFPDQTYTVNQLSALQFVSAQETLDTGIIPTSYYKTENASGQPYVKTAIARTLFSSQPASGSTPAQAKIYKLQSGQGPPTWNLDPRVEDLLRNQNGSELKVKAIDILGNPYETILDIDGYGTKCGAAAASPIGNVGSGFPSNCVKLLEDTPVVKVWEIHKMNEAPSACTTGPCLTHLFSNVFYITAIKGKDYVLIDHTLVNSFNFDEVSVVSTTGGPKDGSGSPVPQTGGWQYSIWQNGMIFYDRAEITVNTPSIPHYLFVADSTRIIPSAVDIPSGTQTKYSIMPTDGQMTLSAAPHYEGPSLNAIPNQSNFIAGGQALLSRLVFSFSPVNQHPVLDVDVHSGQSMSRWGDTKPSYFFPEIPDPDAIDPTFNGSKFATDAAAYLSDAATIIHPVGGRSNDHRFGGFGLGRDQGTAGYDDSYVSEPENFVRYLMSCKNGKYGCQRGYLDSFRWRPYGVSSVTNHFVGYRSEKHPESNLNYYRSAAIEQGNTGTGAISCGGTSGNKDLLGFCKSGFPAPPHRVDASGTPMSTYNMTTNTGNPAGNAYNRTIHHWWTMTEPTHMMPKQELYYWLFTGDYPSLFMGRNRVDTISSTIAFANANNLNFPSTRGRGRYANNIGFLYSLQHDPYDRVLVNEILKMIDARSNKQAEGNAGTSIVTGDYYPVKYSADKTPDPPDSGTYIKTFHYYLLVQGLSVLFQDAIKTADTADFTLLKQLLQDNYYYIYTYGYKSPFEVRNYTPSFNNPANTVKEGTGGLAISALYVNPSNDPTGKLYSDYETAQDVQHYPGLCGGLLTISDIRKNDSSFVPEFNSYFNEFKRLFDQVWVHPTRLNQFKTTLGKQGFGIGINHITDDFICGLTFFQGLPNGSGGGYVNGVYSPTNPANCPDADNDGQTTCAGDCNDTNPNINAKGVETACNDSLDNNCNLLMDCNDPECAKTATCPLTKAYCGNHVLDPGEQCDVAPPGKPNQGGLGPAINNCGIPPGVSPPLNPIYKDGIPPDAYGFCVPAFTSLIQGCQCAGSVLSFYLSTIMPSTIPDNSPNTAFALNGLGFTPTDTVEFIKGGTTAPTITKTITGVSCTSTCTGNVILTNTEISTTLGVGTHSVRLHQGTNYTNSVSLTITSSSTLTLTTITPNTITYNQNSGTLTLTGTNFQNGDQAEFTGFSGQIVTKSTTYGSSTSLTTTLTAADTVTLGTGAGSIRIKRGTSTYSNTIPFTVQGTPSPTPTLTATTPNWTLYNQSSLSLTLTGTNFASGDQAEFTGLSTQTVTKNATFVNATTLTTTLTAGETTTLGLGTGIVRVKRGTTVSNTVPFSIYSIPSNFSLTSQTGSTNGGINLSWTNSSGTPAPAYILRGVPQSHPIYTSGNTIDPTEFDNPANTSAWVINQTNATSPTTFVGTPGVAYCFAAKSTNTAGNYYTSTACATAYTAPVGPFPPGAFTVGTTEGTNPGDLVVSWSDAGGNPAPIYNLRIVPRSDPIAGDGTITLAEFDDPANTGSWVVNTNTTSPYPFNGTPSTEYCAVLKARNTEGKSFSNTSCAMTKGTPPIPPVPPAPPSGGGSGSGGGGGGEGGNGGSVGGGGGSALVCGDGVKSIKEVCETNGNQGCTQNEVCVDCQSCQAACIPTPELCDGVDNDCDTIIDNSCPGETPLHCSNGKRDEGEARIDCGGTCPKLCTYKLARAPDALYSFLIALATPALFFFGLLGKLFGV